MSVPGASARIGAADRVSDVLARDESLVDVFVRHSPHFEKLRNRRLRRVMAALVTVEQAARVAGVALDVLLRDLNGALAGDAAAEAMHDAAIRATDAVSSVPAPAKRPVALPTVELDLREDMRAGREPFSRIMAAVHALGDDRALRLRTIFEPVPLFAVLARRGFLYESRQDAPDDWSVWFWSGASRQEIALPDGSASPDASEPGEGRTHTLDVRGLQPPEPMTRTLAALETLPEGHELMQINVRVPQLLLPMLAERGYACAVDESQADRVVVRIWRPAGG